jgi:mRNA interferase MazF
MNRGEIWLAQVGRKRRPVLVLTRNKVLDVRALVTVAEITTSTRGLAAEIPIDHAHLGLERKSAVNCDGLHTVPQTMLTEFVAVASQATMNRVCAAVSYALGC